jgi:hypothetical protein
LRRLRRYIESCDRPTMGRDGLNRLARSFDER